MFTRRDPQQQRGSVEETQQQSPGLAKPKFSKIKELTPNSAGGFNLLVKVIDDPKLEINRVYLDGTHLKVASVLVGDETGCISLHLKDEQMDLAKKDDVLVLRNAKVQMAKFHIFLRLDQWGIIEKCESKDFNHEVNTENNISKVLWELADPQGQGQGMGNQGQGMGTQGQGMGGQGMGGQGMGGQGMGGQGPNQGMGSQAQGMGGQGMGQGQGMGNQGSGMGNQGQGQGMGGQGQNQGMGMVGGQGQNQSLGQGQNQPFQQPPRRRRRAQRG